MFLIQFESGKFIDAEKIDYINVNEGEVIFTLINDTDSMYKVDDGMVSMFLNNLGALNDNIDCISTCYAEIKDN
jgi:hypothetical protein